MDCWLAVPYRRGNRLQGNVGASIVRSKNQVSVKLSPQAIRMLDELVRYGVYGMNRSDVAGRFIDKALMALLEKQIVTLQKK